MTTRNRPYVLALVASLSLAGCAAAADPDHGVASTASAARSPIFTPTAAGKAADKADRSCQVVLRSIGRYPAGADPLTDCSSGTCLYQWRGTVDVADGVAAGAQAGVLYRLASGKTWWEVAATPATIPTPGFRRYDVAISDHLFGPSTKNSAAIVIEVAAFVRLPDGSRLFDHNRFKGDFDNLRLDQAGGFGFDAGDTCQVTVGTIWFNADFTQSTGGFLRRDGYLQVLFDIDRLTQCRGTHNGYPAWDVVAFAKFSPGGQVFQGSVRQLGNVNGTPTNDATDLPFIVGVPSDATSVELWFHDFTGAGLNCEAWDSNYGHNYRFDVLPRADDPRCLDVEKESGLHTEDDRMAHDQPYCFNYDIDVQADATHCEFWVDGFGNGYVGHYGIPFHWLLAYLKVGPQQGQVLNAGMYTRFHDADTGATGQRFSVGLQESEGTWRAGIETNVSNFQAMQGCNRVVDQFAFFLDVKRPDGKVARLWQSRHGADYRLADAFSLPAIGESIPYGNIQWSDGASRVFESRAACR